jgi:hypothetical protein
MPLLAPDFTFTGSSCTIPNELYAHELVGTHKYVVQKALVHPRSQIANLAVMVKSASTLGKSLNFKGLGTIRCLGLRSVFAVLVVAATHP